MPKLVVRIEYPIPEKHIIITLDIKEWPQDRLNVIQLLTGIWELIFTLVKAPELIQVEVK